MKKKVGDFSEYPQTEYMNKIIKISLVLSFVFSFHSEVMGAQVTDEERDIILGVVTDLGEDIADLCGECDINPGTLETADIDQILDIWRPLITSNEGIFRGLVENLDELRRLNNIFTPENDPYFLGYIMSTLKVFAKISGESGEDIDSEDIGLIISILRDEYGIQIPEVALNVLNNIDELQVASRNGVHQMVIHTRGDRPISLDLTDPALLGAQEGEGNRLERLEIQNAASIVFADENATLTNCVVLGNNLPTCDTRDAAMEFLSPITRNSLDRGTITMQQAQAAMNHANARGYQRVGMEPLYMQFRGIRVRGRAEAFLFDVGTNIDFEEAVILPGMPDGQSSFYLQGQVTAPFTNFEIQAAL